MIWRRPTGPRLFVGNADSAVDWAAEIRPVIVNCANIDYPATPVCRRLWLNLNFRGELNGRTWHQRMHRSVEFCLTASAESNDVLAHCLSGRHRSGAFASLIVALLNGTSYNDGLDTYFEKRQLLSQRDVDKVRGIAEKLGLCILVESIRSEYSELISKTVTPRPSSAPPPYPPAGSSGVPVLRPRPTAVSSPSRSRSIPGPVPLPPPWRSRRTVPSSPSRSRSIPGPAPPPYPPPGSSGVPVLRSRPTVVPSPSRS